MKFGTESKIASNSFLRRVAVERHAIQATRFRFPEAPSLEGLTAHAITVWRIAAEIEYSQNLVADAEHRLRSIAQMCGLLADKSMQLFRSPEGNEADRLELMLREIRELAE